MTRAPVVPSSETPAADTQNQTWDAGVEIRETTSSIESVGDAPEGTSLAIEDLQARTKSLQSLEDALANEFVVMLLEGETVTIDGLGTFYLKVYPRLSRTNPETGDDIVVPPDRYFRAKLDRTLTPANLKTRNFSNHELVKRVHIARAQPTSRVAQAFTSSIRRALTEGVWSDLGTFVYFSHGYGLRSSWRLEAKLKLESVLEIPSQRVSDTLKPYETLNWPELLRRQRKQPLNAQRISSKEIEQIETEIGRPLPSKLAVLLRDVGAAYGGIELLHDAGTFGALRRIHKRWVDTYKLEDGIPFARDSSDYYWCFSLADGSANPWVFYSGPNAGTFPYELRFDDWLAFVLAIADLDELASEFSGNIYDGPKALLRPSDAKKAFSILKRHGRGWRIWNSDANIFFPF